jgi:hypothetical protein
MTSGAILQDALGYVCFDISMFYINRDQKNNRHETPNLNVHKMLDEEYLPARGPNKCISCSLSVPCVKHAGRYSKVS